MSRPKVLRIINRFNLGGPTYNVAYLTKYLESDFETMLIGGYPEKGEESSTFILEKLGISPKLIKEMKRSLNPINDYFAYRTIRKIIREFKPDIVHTHASKAGTLGRLAAFHEKVPVTVHTFHGHVFHSYFNPVSTAFFKRIEKYLAQKTSAIVTISELQKNELCNIHKVCSESNSVVIPLGFDLSRFQMENHERKVAFRRNYSIADDDFVIGIVGRLVPVKNHKLFIQSLALLKKMGYSNIKAFIVGDGQLKGSLVEYAQSLSLLVSENLKENNLADLNFYSWCSEIETILPGLDLVCLTSLNEGTPVSLIEAQASSIPVVTTNVGGIQDVVCKDAGIIVDNFNPQNFAEAIIRIIERRHEIHKMGLAGRNFVTDKFDYSRLIKDTSALYWSLLTSP